MTIEQPPPPTEREKQHWKEAERAFDHRSQTRRAHNESVDRYALLTIRSIQLSAAGGIVAVLGFYGTHYDVFSTIPGKSGELSACLVLLFVALIATMLVAGAGYFSQVCFAASADKWRESYVHPYLSDTPESKRIQRLGTVFRVAAIVLTFVAALLLIAGAWAAFLMLS